MDYIPKSSICLKFAGFRPPGIHIFIEPWESKTLTDIIEMAEDAAEVFETLRESVCLKLIEALKEQLNRTDLSKVDYSLNHGRTKKKSLFRMWIRE